MIYLIDIASIAIRLSFPSHTLLFVSQMPVCRLPPANYLFGAAFPELAYLLASVIEFGTNFLELPSPDYRSLDCRLPTLRRGTLFPRLGFAYFLKLYLSACPL